MKRSKKLPFFFGVLLFFITLTFAVATAILIYDYASEVLKGKKFLIALVVFAVILSLAFLMTVIDVFRRKILVEKPNQEILTATEKISSGDFSVRLQIRKNPNFYNEYDELKDHINVMVEELNKNKILNADFVSAISHEFKTPIAVISNYAQLLQQEGISEEEKKKYVDTIYLTSKKLSEMVSSVLLLNKIENGGIMPPKEIALLEDVVAESVLKFENFAESKNVEFILDIEDFKVDFYLSYIGVILDNLISNAIKFSDRGKSIFISAKARGEDVVFTVKDSGCGISAEVGEKIFEKFYQADESRAKEGNGLGLALVKKIIDAVGGEISVESRIGQGSTFTVILRNAIYKGKNKND